MEPRPRAVRGSAILVIAAAAAIYVLHEAAAALIPIFVSVLLAYALEPFIVGLTRWRVPRLVASALVLTLLAALAGAVVRTAHNQARALIDNLPATVASFQRSFVKHQGSGMLDRLREAADEMNRAAAARGTPPAPGVERVEVVQQGFNVRDYLIGATPGAAAIGLDAFVIVLLTFLLLATGDLYKRKLVKLAGPRLEEKRITLDVIQTIDRQIERYLVVRLLISAIVATATALPLWWLGLDHPIVWGLVAGALNVLPILGPTLAVALISVAAFLQFRSVETTAIAALIAAAVAAVEGNFITPVLTGRAGELNTVAVFIAVLFWGWIWGMWGLLLAIPIMVAIKAAADRIEPLQPVGEVLGRH